MGKTLEEVAPAQIGLECRVSVSVGQDKGDEMTWNLQALQRSRLC